MTRRLYLLYSASAVGLAALVGCRGGTPTLLGYRLGAQALYDENIKTVYVPVFNNRAFQTTPYRGMEVEITRAVVQEINAKTPFRVTSDKDAADTELLGNVVAITKNILNRNQQNLIREEEVVLTVDILWRDLRDGRNLSAPRQGVTPGSAPPDLVPPPEPIPFDPNAEAPSPVPVPQLLIPVRLVATGRVLPELGESITTGEQKALNMLATQIVSMMEKPWGLR